MLPISVINGYDLTLESLSTAALTDLRALLSGLEDVSPERTKAVLFEAFPEVFNPYAAATSAVSASFYEEVRAAADVKGSFAAETLDTVEAPRWNGLVGFGTRSLEQSGTALMYSLLSGGLTSILSTMAADTIYGNAQKDPVTARFQRIPKAGCCGFCGMLASRGADYDSEESALRVVGRGVPVEKTKGKVGGQGRGLRPRGTRAIGEKFHDHCKCRAVQVYEGNAVEMRDDAKSYFESYGTARDKINEGLTLETVQFKSSDGSLKNKYTWVNADGKVISSQAKSKMIATAIRHDLDVK
jgi:hypothetical protein